MLLQITFGGGRIFSRGAFITGDGNVTMVFMSLGDGLVEDS